MTRGFQSFSAVGGDPDLVAVLFEQMSELAGLRGAILGDKNFNALVVNPFSGFHLWTSREGS
jgi:hypothetical protein